MSLAGKLLTKHLKSIILAGEIVDNAVAGTTGDIKVLIRDGSLNILYATGTDVPADDTAGYAKGCIFIDTNVAAGTAGTYVNIGVTTAANFDVQVDG